MKGKLQTLFSSRSDEWRTPENALHLVRKMGPILLDPCTTDENPTGAERYYTKETNGLINPWVLYKPGVIFVNPPYSSVEQWIARAASCQEECLVLIPARTDTRYWHTWIVDRADAVCFWKGRLKFTSLAGRSVCGWCNASPEESCALGCAFETSVSARSKPATDCAPFPSAMIYYGQRPELFSDVFGEVGWVVLK